MTIQQSQKPKFVKGRQEPYGEDLDDLWNGGQSSIDSGETATGTNLATAYAISWCNTQFASVPSSTGAALPSALKLQADSPNLDINRILGREYFIYNDDSANALTVYAPDGSTIDGTAGATGVTLSHAKSCAYKAIAVTSAGVVTWRSALNGATSS